MPSRLLLIVLVPLTPAVFRLLRLRVLLALVPWSSCPGPLNVNLYKNNQQSSVINGTTHIKADTLSQQASWQQKQSTKQLCETVSLHDTIIRQAGSNTYQHPTSFPSMTLYTNCVPDSSNVGAHVTIYHRPKHTLLNPRVT